MANTLIETHGLDELIARMKKYPLELAKGMAVTMAASLIALWESVPAYPEPPADSKYDRTGTLGRSLGSGFSGGAEGEPSIYTIRKLGEGYEGKFGTSLEYAPHVIGDDTQAAVHSGRWWNMRFVANKASEKINRLWQALGNKLASFLEGKSK